MTGTTLWDNILVFNKEYGAGIIKNSVLDNIHLYSVNPSTEISYQYVVHRPILFKIYLEVSNYEKSIFYKSIIRIKAIPL